MDCWYKDCTHSLSNSVCLFHVLPSDYCQRKIWKRYAGITRIPKSQTIAICSCHFNDTNENPVPYFEAHRTRQQYNNYLALQSEVNHINNNDETYLNLDNIESDTNDIDLNIFEDEQDFFLVEYVDDLNNNDDLHQNDIRKMRKRKRLKAIRSVNESESLGEECVLELSIDEERLLESPLDKERLRNFNMPECSIPGCKSRYRHKKMGYFRFPKINMTSDQTTRLSMERQSKWLTALRRQDAEKCKYLRVCEVHFTSGKSAHLIDKTNPDWVPTLNLFDDASEFFFHNLPDNQKKTIADLRMNCSVFRVRKPNVYNEHNYSKFGFKMQDNNSSKRDNTENDFPRPESRFHIKCCRILNPRLNRNTLSCIT